MKKLQKFVRSDSVCPTPPYKLTGKTNYKMKLLSLYRRRREQLSEALTFRNLAIYLLEQTPEPAMRKRCYLTLDEALRSGRARLHETGRVGELEIENLTCADLYAQAGEVVKGGWQDRALGLDFIVPRQMRPRRMRVRTFCVERGRWSRRGDEAGADTFGSASHTAASRDLKLSIRHAGSQAAVWSSVDAAQDKLSRSLGVDVRSAVSPSSLPLTMESEVVRNQVEPFIRAFGNLPEAHASATGFVFAINGQLSSAELYASPELFGKLWPKLLEAAALEALAEANAPGMTCSTPDRATVAEWLRRARRGRKTRHEVSSRVTIVVREGDNQVSFETMDAEQSNLCIHQTILAQPSAIV
jgi:hypothetical protein